MVRRNPARWLSRRMTHAMAGICSALFWLLLAGAAHAETLSANGITLHYETHGEGKPLLLVHGGLGHSGAWEKQIPVLSRQFRVITLDSRGHGRSTFDDTPISYALMTRDVLALLDHLGIERADLLGWSDGGIIGLELAIHHPSRVGRVIAFGANFHPSGVRPDTTEHPNFARYIEQAAADYQRLSPAPGRWDEFLANIGRMWASEPDYSRAEMAAITSPVLVLGGLSEEAIFVEHMRETHRRIPGSALRIMEGTGHFAMWEQPETFNRIVLDYLTQ